MYSMGATFGHEKAKGGEAEIGRWSISAVGVRSTKWALKESQCSHVPCSTVSVSRGGRSGCMHRQQQPCSGSSTWGGAEKMGMPSTGVSAVYNRWPEQRRKRADGLCIGASTQRRSAQLVEQIATACKYRREDSGRQTHTEGGRS
ncbi:unnamed protein product [Calypogeia fissa]